MSEFYDQSSSLYSTAMSIESATLQKKVYLPLLPKEYPTDYVLQAYRELEARYTTANDAYSDIAGNFYIPLLFPLVENGESTVVKYKAPKAKKILNTDSKFTSSEYMEKNYVSLVIPKYIAMDFRDYIPAGTKFAVGFIGGSAIISNIKVLAVAEKPSDYAPEEMIETFGLSYEAVKSKVQEDIQKIVEEEERRNVELGAQKSAMKEIK